MDTVIRADGLCKSFRGNPAVDHLSFDVPKGAIFALLGDNGAGKTTTIRMITGFLPPSGGRVTVDGKDLFESPREARRQVGYLPENVALYTEMRVSEYLAYRARLEGLSRAEAAKAIPIAVERCLLGDVRNQIIGTLSKGYRQRVGLADALVVVVRLHAVNRRQAADQRHAAARHDTQDAAGRWRPGIRPATSPRRNQARQGRNDRYSPHDRAPRCERVPTTLSLGAQRAYPSGANDLRCGAGAPRNSEQPLGSAYCVTVMVPGTSMMTSSPAPGTAPLLQLLGVSQVPPAELIQWTVDNTTRSSTCSMCGR